MTVAHVLDDRFADHFPPDPHPERPARYHAVRRALLDAGLPERGPALPARAATRDELLRVHTPDYLAELEAIDGAAGWLDPDTYYSPGSWRAARTAAGAAIDVTRAVLAGRASRGLAPVRPPGHHAEADRAMGFCLLNNAALAVAAARAEGVARVAVVDWDVHHGNGTHRAFYRDPSVLYLSCHQYPHFPGTGRAEEVGADAGLGTTINVALPAGCGDPEYRAVFDQLFEPELRRFRPELVLVSAGFDAHAEDPLAGMRVTDRGFAELARQVVSIADEVAGGRLVCVLEGGYNLAGLATAMVTLLDAMDPHPDNRPSIAPPRPTGAIAPAAAAAIARTQRALAAARGGA